MRLFPLDIFSVCDFKEWQRNFFWPVSEYFTEKLGLEIYRSLKSLYEEEKDGMYGSILRIESCYFFIQFLSMLHALKVVQVLEEKGYTGMYAENINFSGKNVFIKNRIYKFLLNSNSIPEYPINKWEIERKIFLKKFYRIMINYINKIRVFNSISAPSIIFNPNFFLKEYLNYTQISTILTRSEDWLKDIMEKGQDIVVPHDLDRLSNEFLVLFENISRKFQIRLSSRVSEYVRNYIYLNLRYIYKIFLILLEHPLLRRPVRLFSALGGNIAIRILSEVVRFKDGEVFHFTEEGNVTGALNPVYSMVLFNTCDYFSVYNSYDIKFFNELLELYPAFRSRTVRLVYNKFSKYKYLYSKFHHRKLYKKQIRTIMYVPSSYQGDLKLLYFVPDLIRLDYEIRVINLLTKRGYEVIYKKHPKGLLMHKEFELFEKIGINCISTPFLEVMDLADMFIFDYYPSTALFEAMCTDKPIVFIYTGYPKIFPEVMNLLAKRCIIVNTEFDENNRVVFDEKRLIEAINMSPSIIDYEFVYKYLVSDK